MRRIRATSALLGPAFVAAIAYVDPGNVAANVSAGAQFGYLLVWVIVVANIMAAVVQYLSSKLGVVTGRTLPELVRDRAGPRTRLLYWAQAEIVAMATDLAEVVGGAVAIQLLFGLPLVLGGLLTAVVSMVLLAVQTRGGQRAFELVVMAALAVICVGFIGIVVLSPPPVSSVVAGLLPRFTGSRSVLLAAAIIGATVMPHVIYLHSGLVRDRHGHLPPGPEQTRLLRASRWDVGLAMVVAGIVNVAMLVLAAHAFGGRAAPGTLQAAHAMIAVALGPAAALLLALGLLASGLASTSVGAYAGAMIMEGLLHKRIPLLARRLVTVIPALVLLAAGVDSTAALIVSQVVLSLGIPFVLVPLLRFTADAQVMAGAVNAAMTTVLAAGATAAVTALNVVLLALLVTGHS